MSEHFPSLPEAVLAAANQLGAWLAQDDLPQDPQIELVVLAGNAVIPTIDFACRLAAHHAVPLLISGGIGHSTSFLYQSVLNDPRYSTIPVDDRAEAHILADIALSVLGDSAPTNRGGRPLHQLRRERALYPADAGAQRYCAPYGRGGSGSDHAAANDGDICPRLARRPACADVVQRAGLFTGVV